MKRLFTILSFVPIFLCAQNEKINIGTAPVKSTSYQFNTNSAALKSSVYPEKFELSPLFEQYYSPKGSMSFVDSRAELLEQRSRESKSFLLADGKTLTVIGAGELHYKKDGLWHTILDCIHQNTDTNTSNAYPWASVYNEHQVFLGKNSQEGIFIKDETNQFHFWKNIRISYWDNNLNSLGELPLSFSTAPIVTGNTITYTDDSGNIEYTLVKNAKGFKTAYKINNALGLGTLPNLCAFWSISEDITISNNITPSLSEKGTLNLKADNQTIFKLNTPIYFDNQISSEDKKHGSYKLHTNDNGQIALSMLMESNWLTDPNRVFPIVLDPTVTYVPDNTAQHTGTVEEDNGCSFGNDNDYDDEMRIGFDDGNSDNDYYSSFARFNITAIPDNNCITNAYSRYYQSGWNNGNGSDNNTKFYYGPLNPSNLAPDNANCTTIFNSLNSSPFYSAWDVFGTGCNGSDYDENSSGWKDFTTNISARVSSLLLQDWLVLGFDNGYDNTNCGSGHSDPIITNNDEWITFSGRSSTNRPQLIVTHEAPSVAPTSITGTTTICNGASTTLTVNGGSLGGGAVANWYTVSCGGTLVGTGLSITVSPTSTTTYFVRYQGICNTTNCISTTVTVNPNATINLTSAGTTAAQNLCLNNAITPITYAIGGGGTGAGATGLPAGLTAIFNAGVFTISGTPTATGTFNYTVTTTGTCTQTSASGSIVVRALPTPSVSPNTGTLTCSTTSIALTASGGGTYAWSNSLGASATVNVNTPNTYTVTVTGANSCTAQASAVISQNITPPTASINPTTGTLTCSTTSIALTASGGGTYAWSNSLGSSATVSVNSPNTYTVTVTGANNCTAQASTVISQNITPPTASVTPSSGTLTCATTSINLTASGGASYVWSSSLGTNASVSVNTPSTYTVTATGANGCTAQNSAVIGQNITAPTASITPNTGTLTCTTTSINLTAGGGSTYAWSNSLGTNTAVSVSAPNTYIVTVTNAANGCTAQASAVIGQNITAPTASITPTTGTLTCTTTSIGLTASGGSSYTWSNGLGASASVSVNTPNTYTVSVTDATNGCTAQASSTIAQNITAPTASVTPSTGTLTCATTSISLTAAGGSSYAWSNSLGTGSIVNVNTPNTYTVTATDGTNGCTAQASAVITQNITAPTASVTPNTGTLNCTTTSIGLTAAGGTSYAWSNSLGTNASVSVTTPNTYTVTVTDGTNGCTAQASAVITQNITAPTASITPSTGTLTCTTTSINLTASGGTSYAWSNSLGTTAIVSVTTPNTYTVTVTDASNGCTAQASALIGQNITAPTASISPATGTLTCTTTSIGLTASGGSAYVWSNGLGTSAGATATAPNTYTVTVTDGTNGCTAQASSVIAQNITAPTASVTPSTGTLTCATTSISLTAAGGASYAWSNSLGSNATVSVNTPNTYSVTVTDATNGCTAQASAVITQNIAAPTASVSPNTGTLTCTTTSISLTATGGTSYAWSNSLGTNATVSVTAPNTYNVTVTGANGCTALSSAVIGQNITAPTASITPSTGTLTCTTTSINLTASGGASYAWSNSLGTTAIVSVTTPNTYTVTVTDATNGCTAQASALIGQNITAPTASISPATGTLTCTTTSIGLTASGGASYVWSNGLGTNANASVNAPNTYTVTVTDGTNGCTAQASSVITQNITAPTASVTPSTGTLTCATTAINLTAAGGASYAWSNSLGSNATVSVNTPNTYSVTVTDATNGCTAQASAVITQNITAPTASVTPTTATLTCATTAISLTATGGASYAWSSSLGTNATVSVTSPNTYNVTVTGANGCTAQASALINQNITAPTASITPATGTLTCSTTSLSLTAAGGSTYAWSNGLGTTAGVIVNTPNTYTVTVTDASNGCTAQASTLITQNITPPTTSITPSTAILTCANTSVGLTANGGASYAWSNGLGTANSVSVSSVGTYTVTATGANGCTASASASITQNTTPPTASISPISGTLTCSTTSIALTASGGGTYAWSNGLGATANVSVNAAGTYSVTVTDATNGCTADVNVVISQNNTPPTASITPNTAVLTCANNAISLTATGGNSFAWSNALGTTANVSVTTPNTYTVTVTGANGCTASTSAVITQNITPPTASITPATGTLTCTTTSIGLTAAGGGTYSWSNGLGTTASANVNSAGTFVVTVTNTNGCTASASAVISANTSVPTVVATNNGVNCTIAPFNLSMTSTVTGGTGPFTYAWSGPGGFTSTIANPTIFNINQAGSGTFTVTVTGANGCPAAAASTQVNLSFAPAQPIITGNSPICSGDVATLSTQQYTGSTVSYAWSFNSGPLVNSNNNTYVVNPATTGGNYQVTVTVNGCTATSVPYNLVVRPRPTATPTNNGATCVSTPFTLNLNAAAASGTAPYNYSWTGPNGFVSNIANPSIANATAANSGLYSVLVTDANGCQSTASSTVVTITTAPIAPTITGINTLCEGDDLSLSIPTYSGANVVYQWFYNTGLLANGNNNTLSIPNMTIANAGNYTAQVTVGSCVSAVSSIYGVNVTPLPTITAVTGGGAYCEGSNISLVPTTNPSTGLSAQWTGPNGFISQANPLNLNNAATNLTGTYFLTVSTSGNCQSQPFPVSVLINPRPNTPTVFASGTQLCSGDSLNLSTTPYTGTSVNYDWFLNGSLINATGIPNTIINPVTSADAGNYQVQVTVDGCVSLLSGQTAVGVGTAPSAAQINATLDNPTDALAAANTLNTCEGSTVLFESAFSPSQSYLWVGPAGFTSTSHNPVINNATALNNGTYTLYVTNTASACVTAVSVSLTINPLPATPTATNDSPVCPGSDVNLDVAAGGGVAGITYTWYNATSNLAIGTGDPLTLNNVTAAGDYYVIASNAAGCASVPSNTTNVTLNAIGAQNAFAGVDFTACGASATLSAEEPTVGSGTWSSNQAGVQFANPNAANTDVFGLPLGTTLLVWTINNSVCPNAISDTVLVTRGNGLIAVDDNYNVPFRGSLDSIMVTANDTLNGNAYTFQLVSQPSEGHLIDNGNGYFTYTPDINFNGQDQFVYQICGTVCPDVCDEATVFLNINNDGPCRIPNVMTPNGDGLNDVFIAYCLDGNAYPNNELSIFNRWGTQIYTASPYQNNWRGQFDADIVPEGTYFYVLQLHDADNTVIKGYVVIHR